MRSCQVVVVAGSLVVFLTACEPSLNWRDVSIGSTGLTALFPCKPETVTRTLPIADTDQAMALRSCEAGGVTFAVAQSRLALAGQAPMVLARWRDTTLSGLGAVPASTSLLPPKAAPALPQLLAVRAARDPSVGPALSMHGLWFAKGPDVFAAFVLAPAIPVDVADTFFAGLRLQ